MNRRDPSTEIGPDFSPNVFELVEQYTGRVEMPTYDEQGNPLAPLPPIIQAAQILACACLHGVGLLVKAHRRKAKAMKAGCSSIAAALQTLASNVNTLASANAAIADAVSSHGEAVSAAIDVHRESIARLADAIETRAP